MLRCFSKVLILVVAMAVSLNAYYIDFEDLYTSIPANDTSAVPADYEGFTWNSSSRLMPIDYLPQTTGPGYANGMDGNVALFSGGSAGSNTIVISSDEKFDFLGALITSTWKTDQDVWVGGYADSSLAYHSVINTSYDSAYSFSFDYEDIDMLVIMPGFGGTDFYDDYRGNHIVVDNIQVDVPEPFTISLLTTGGVLLLTRRKA